MVTDSQYRGHTCAAESVSIFLCHAIIARGPQDSSWPGHVHSKRELFIGHKLDLICINPYQDT